jgi:membrane protein implicated in regulation of membrane protease activity
MADGRTLAGQQTVRDEPTLGQLVASASRDLSLLVRSEIELAKAEVRVDVKNAIKGGGMFGAAAFLGLLAVILLSIAAAYGLTALGLHPAWAFLIIAGAYLLVAGILALVGLRAVKKVGPPERTIRTAKESVAAITTRRPVSTDAGTGQHRAVPARRS